MKKLSFIVIALTTALATAPAVKADSFSFTASGTGFTGGGTLTGSSLGGGLFSITGGAFTINGVTATIIDNPSTGAISDYAAGAGYMFQYDDVINTNGSPSLDDGGLLFQLSNGAVVNIWEVSGVYYWNEWNGSEWLYDPSVGAGGSPILSSNLDAVPEPSSLILLGTGLLLLAAFAFRKSKESAVQTECAQAA